MLVVVVQRLCDAEYILSKVCYKKWDDYEIYSCEFCDKEFILVITGYGKVNIGSTLEYVFNNASVSSVLQIGTAGSLNKCDILDAFVVDKSLEWDIDFTKLGYNIGTLPNENKGIYNSNFFLKRCAIKSICDFDKKYKCGVMASADTFVASQNLSCYIKKNFCADAVDTDTGSAAQLCYNKKTPFIGIKVISNYANENASKQFRLYNDEASSLCQKIALNFIENFEY